MTPKTDESNQKAKQTLGIASSLEDFLKCVFNAKFVVLLCQGNFRSDIILRGSRDGGWGDPYKACIYTHAITTYNHTNYHALNLADTLIMEVCLCKI
jgi:3-deoxy-D-arabino-heptulosonate 7-phosphate (DAHP) synthase